MSDNTQECRRQEEFEAMKKALEESQQESKRKDRLMEEKEREIKKLKSDKEALTLDKQSKERETKAKSLIALLRGTTLVDENSYDGTLFSNVNPPGHPISPFEARPFNNWTEGLIRLIEELETETEVEKKLESYDSQMIVSSINQKIAVKTTSAEPLPKTICSNKAAVAHRINVLLDDVVAICNAIIFMSAENSAFKPARLQVKQEMSIFSNRCDHTVVFDSTTKMPIFCVATKKTLGEKFEGNEGNESYGQVYDQLQAMRLSGHLCPLGALTCFNETYLACLDEIIDWDVLPTSESLKKSIAHLPGKQLFNTTPSLLKVKAAETNPVTNRRQRTDGVFEASARYIVRSSKCITHDRLASALVIILLNALKGNYEEKTVQKYPKGYRFENADCIEMGTSSYQFGKLTTTYQGLYQKPKLLRWMPTLLPPKLYLLQCIGAGSTSKAYHASTIDGYECVVKLYVQRHYEDGTEKKSEQFKKDSKAHVTNEVKYYNTIYKDELNGYVWQRRLNSMDCIILPFFHPVSDEDQEAALPEITECLEMFTEHSLAFRKCDQSWRHIGRLNGTIYMFDLGDLEDCKSKEAATLRASEHLNWLKTKMEASIRAIPTEVTDESS